MGKTANSLYNINQSKLNLIYILRVLLFINNQ